MTSRRYITVVFSVLAMTALPGLAQADTGTHPDVVTPAFSASCIDAYLSENVFTKTYTITNHCNVRADIRIDLANHTDIDCHTINPHSSETITVAATASLRNIYYC